MEAVEVQEEAEVVELAAASHQIVQQPVWPQIKEPGVFEPRCFEKVLPAYRIQDLTI